ncbi:MAG: hypothetical protein ACRCV3_04400 [Desulfovibrionaceae bacterium]
MRTTYCSILDNTSISHFFAMRESIFSFDKEAIFYVLCLCSTSYTIIENMELHNVYIIHITELEERDKSLSLIYEFLAPQVYSSLLHASLLEYLLFFNPLIQKIVYISSYCFCLYDVNSNIQEDDFSCFYNNIGDPSPLCIVVYASDRGKEIVNQYKKECYALAKNTRAIYENVSEALKIIIQKYSLQNSSYCILSEAKMEEIHYKNNALCLGDSIILFLYTKEIIPLSKRIYSSLYPFTVKNRYVLMKYAIKDFLRCLDEASYRVRIFSPIKRKKNWKNIIGGLLAYSRSRRILRRKEYYFFLF